MTIPSSIILSEDPSIRVARINQHSFRFALQMEPAVISPLSDLGLLLPLLIFLITFVLEFVSFSLKNGMANRVRLSLVFRYPTNLPTKCQLPS